MCQSKFVVTGVKRGCVGEVLGVLLGMENETSNTVNGYHICFSYETEPPSWCAKKFVPSIGRFCGRVGFKTKEEAVEYANNRTD